MIRRSSHPLPAVACALALVLGCHSEDPGSGADIGITPGAGTFTEDFSSGFPGENWVVRAGDPAVMADQGNAAPGLVLGPSVDDVRISSAFTFSTAKAMTLSFHLATPLAGAEGAFFKFDIATPGVVFGETSVLIGAMENAILLRIKGDEESVVFITGGGFHTIAFMVDAAGNAMWFVDGLPAMIRDGFPKGNFRMEMEANAAASSSGFVVDNVTLTQP